MTTVLSGPVVVAGGCGAVGTMLAAALRGDGHRVVLVDPAATRPGPGMLPGDITDPAPQVAAALGSASTVILAVPDAIAVAAVPALAGLLSPEALLVETLSVKTPVAAALHMYLPDRAALGINPMFAPALGAAGRAVLVVGGRGRAAGRHLPPPGPGRGCTELRTHGAVGSAGAVPTSTNCLWGIG